MSVFRAWGGIGAHQRTMKKWPLVGTMNLKPAALDI